MQISLWSQVEASKDPPAPMGRFADGAWAICRDPDAVVNRDFSLGARRFGAGRCKGGLLGWRVVE
jgi:hypothetical protein